MVEMEREGGSSGRREEDRHIYRMTQELLSIGDDYWIEDENGDKAFYVDGKAFRLRNTLVLKDAHGKNLYKIQERLIKIRDTMDIKREDDSLAATVKKAFISILRDRWEVEVPDGPDMDIRGSILDHEYVIDVEGTRIAEVSKKWFHIRDTYGVEIEAGQDNALILAIAAALDQMSHES
jgi:uncharacterized protein YxjI